MPKNLKKTQFWGKPVFISGADMWQIFNKKKYPIIEKNGRTWCHFTTRKVGKKNKINTDKEMFLGMKKLLGNQFQENRNAICYLVNFPKKKMIGEVGDLSQDSSLCSQREQLIEIIRNLAQIIEVSEYDIGIGGSRLLGFEKISISDVDLTVYCALNEMEELLKKIENYKKKYHLLQRYKFGNLFFPYKLVLKKGIEIDVFPKTKKVEEHPFNKLIEWEKVGEITTKQFRISDTSLSHESWPVYSVEKEESPLIIMCNGFRGVFKRGDTFKAKCVPIKLYFEEQANISAWAIQNPFKEIECPSNFFSPRY